MTFLGLAIAFAAGFILGCAYMTGRATRAVDLLTEVKRGKKK